MVTPAHCDRKAGTDIKVELGDMPPWRASTPQDVSEGCANMGVLVDEAQATGPMEVVDWDVQIFSDAAGGSGFGVYWDGKYCAE
ncbi:hypothetical protein NDU88_006954 [Pleurodeles waltl]|uniref:Lipoprotein n=1 Tax=Pleurodeles waltl TaxID=8319 RepID=A0AAV7PJW0_PLEWA|nr:hypothetical protein NDU88_006954 [Pleurodeles waltl]